MISRMTLLLSAALTLAALAAPSAAGERDDARDQSQEPKDLPTVKEFLAFQKELRGDLEAGEYGTISEEEMELVDKSQATLQRILSGVDDIGELPLDKRIEAYNAQEAIKAVLTESVEDRPICRRRSRVGTHFKTTTCYTRRESKEMQERARHVMDRMTTIAPLPSEG